MTAGVFNTSFKINLPMKKFIALLAGCLMTCLTFAQSAYEYNENGLDDYYDEDYDAAIKNFNEAIKLDRSLQRHISIKGWP